MVKRRKPGKKRRGRGSTDSVSSGQSMPSPEQVETEEPLQIKNERMNLEDGTVGDSNTSLDGAARAVTENREDPEPEALLRLPEMTDTSMDTVGQPLRDVMDRLNGALDGKSWERQDDEEEEKVDGVTGVITVTSPLQHQPFREDEGGEPPDPDSESCLVASAAPAHFYCFTSHSSGTAAKSGSHHDSAGNGQSQTVYSGHEDEGEGEQDSSSKIEEKERADVEMEQPNGPAQIKSEANGVGEGFGPAESSHPAEFRLDERQQLLFYVLLVLYELILSVGWTKKVNLFFSLFYFQGR